MERIAVRSSVLAAIGYDSVTRALEVEFPDGQVYRYGDVPREYFEQLLSAESLGHFYNRKIRNHFLFIRVPRSRAV